MNPNNRRSRIGSTGPVPLTIVVVLMLVLAGCDGGADPEGSPLEDLQLVGVDFELNSMVITNNGSDTVRTEGLWAYRDGESFQFSIFRIEPRASILFNMRELGEISTEGGEIALADSESFDDASLLQYVAWGDNGLDLLPTATEAGLWPSEETAEITSDAIFLVRSDPTANGPLAWESSNQAP